MAPDITVALPPFYLAICGLGQSAGLALPPKSGLPGAHVWMPVARIRAHRPRGVQARRNHLQTYLARQVQERLNGQWCWTSSATVTLRVPGAVLSGLINQSAVPIDHGPYRRFTLEDFRNSICFIMNGTSLRRGRCGKALRKQAGPAHTEWEPSASVLQLLTGGGGAIRLTDRNALTVEVLSVGQSLANSGSAEAFCNMADRLGVRSL